MPAGTLKRALLIAGPTASGKSALALKLARARNGVIINADSMQVYRELRILSARPTPEDEALVPHRLYGHVSGREDYSVARWLAEVRAILAECWQDGRLPILCGGTGLYFRALEQGLADVPPIPPEVRERWRGFDGDLHAELAQRDAASAARLHPSDRQRLIRALEVVDGTGQPLSHWQKQAEEASILQGVEAERLFLDVSRETLYARAETRFDRMMDEGALGEVQAVLDYPPSLTMMKAIGVPELSAALRGSMTREAAIASAKTATRNYIKRQLTWWRGQMQAWRRVTPDDA